MYLQLLLKKFKIMMDLLIYYCVLRTMVHDTFDASFEHSKIIIHEQQEDHPEFIINAPWTKTSD